MAEFQVYKSLEQDEEDNGVQIPEAFSRSQEFDFSLLKRKKLYVHHNLIGAAAAVAANYNSFWIAPFPCVVTKIQESHRDNSVSGTLNIEKLASGVDLDSGVALLSSTISLSANAKTIQTGTLSTTPSTLQLASGDRLAMVDAGDLTSSVNVMILIEILY